MSLTTIIADARARFARIVKWFAANSKIILSAVMIYISIAGLFTFSLFILEEAFQTVMFGTWPAKDARRWDIVKSGTELMRRITYTGHVVTWFGLIQPLAFISYRMYFIGADYYIESLEAECFANAPDLFIGEKVTINFKPQRIIPMPNGKWKAAAGRVGIIYDSKPEFERKTITGVLNENLEIISPKEQNHE